MFERVLEKEAALLHAGRPTVVTVGVGAQAVANLRELKVSDRAKADARTART